MASDQQLLSFTKTGVRDQLLNRSGQRYRVLTRSALDVLDLMTSRSVSGPRMHAFHVASWDTATGLVLRELFLESFASNVDREVIRQVIAKNLDDS